MPDALHNDRPTLSRGPHKLIKKLSSESIRFYLRATQDSFKTQLRYLKRGEIAKALRGFSIYLSVGANALSSIQLLPRRRYCEFCHWSGFAFIPIYYVDGYRAEVFCPNCRLMDRYRTMVYFARRSKWGERVRQLRPRTLDVAPTKSSGKMLAQELDSRETIGFDISNPGRMFRVTCSTCLSHRALSIFFFAMRYSITFQTTRRLSKNFIVF